MKRRFDSNVPELMDVPQPPGPELAEDLRNLECINAWFGGHRLVIKHLPDMLRQDKPNEVLDLAAGFCDIPRKVVGWCRRRQIAVRITAVEFQPGTLDLAARANRNYPEMELVRADIRDFRPGRTWDVVLCTLALHHFSDTEAVEILRNMRRLARRHILVTDIRRSRLTTLAIRCATTLLFRSAMTRHDARLSAERAFSLMEFRQLAKRAGWRNFTQSTHRHFRQALRFDSHKPT